MQKDEHDAKEVIMHSAAIQIENNLTMLQRRAFTALVGNAYDKLLTEEIHCIRVQRLMEWLYYESHNEEYLKAAVRALVHCILEWNILEKDRAKWGVAALLASVEIENGVCTYAFAPHLRPRLHNPSMYARINMLMQSKFGSKYALALWEICTDYLGAAREYGETPPIALEKFRKLMGVSEGEYTQFKILNRAVIKPAVTEINLISDFCVEAEYQRVGRKIAALKFKIRRVKLLPATLSGQYDLFPDLADMPLAVKLLTDAGFSMQDAFAVWHQGWKFVDEAVRPTPSGEEDEAAFTQYVREKIHLLKRQVATGKVESRTGFLREALKKNYANPEFAQESAHQQMAEAHQDAKRRKADKQRLVWRLEELQKAQTQALQGVFSEIAASVPEVVEAALPRILAEQPFLRHVFYHPDHSALENYQANIGLAALVNPHLEPYAPERVQAVKDQYAPQITALEAQIAALQ